MKRVNGIIKNPKFQYYMEKIKELEKERRYCIHDFEHALTVARITYAYLLEQHSSFDKEIIYSAALLHDIGRFIEYETGEDHAIASARLAQEILEEENFTPDEIRLIQEGILEHRKNPENSSPLGRALALSDDWARNCRTCKAKDSCYKYSEDMDELKY